MSTTSHQTSAPTSLSEMLFDPRANWDAIFLAMQTLAARVGKSVRFASASDRQDAVGDAVCHAMERLGRYDPERRCAEAYFQRVLKRFLLKWANRQPHPWHDLPQRRADDAGESSLLDTPGRPLERRHCWEYRRFSSRLTCAADIRLTRRLIDRCLARTHALLPAAGDPTAQARVASAIDVLQELRKEMLGRYSRITADHARFSARRRVETAV